MTAAARPRRRRTASASVLIVGTAASLTLSGCEVLHVPVLHPTSAPVTAVVVVNLPPGIREGAHLAFDDLHSGRLGIDLQGISVEAVDLPDTVNGVNDPGFAAQQLRAEIQSSGNVLALLGPRDVRSAEREMPIASNAQLLTVSPGIIDDCLTQSQPTCPRGEPASLYPRGSVDGSHGVQFFFQIPASESTEGPADADYAYHTLARHTGVVVEDATVTGRQRGDAFARRFTDDGGVVTATITDAVDITSAPAIAAKIGAASPDVVFLGGADPAQMGTLRAAMRTGSAIVIGGNELLQDGFLTAAGDAASGTYASSLEPDAAYSRSDIASRLAARYPRTAPVRGFALDAYFATVEVLQTIAIATSAAAQGQAYAVLPTPQAVLAAFLGADVSPVGVPVDAGDRLGTIQFDPNGEDLDKVVSIHVVAGRAWSFKDQVSFSG